MLNGIKIPSDQDVKLCTRCGTGSTYEECTWDLVLQAEPLVVRICINCGERVDPVILANRQMSLAEGFEGFDERLRRKPNPHRRPPAPEDFDPAVNV